VSKPSARRRQISGDALVAAAPIAMAITEGEMHILCCANAAFLQLLGRAGGSAIGHPFTAVADGSGLEHAALTLDRVSQTGTAEEIPAWEHATPGGSRVHQTITVWPIDDGMEGPQRLAMQVHTAATTTQMTQKLTERLFLTALEEQERSEEAQRHADAMEHQALHDALTGLPNRTLLTDRTAQAIKIADRAGKGVALLLVDLNRFKAVNDRFGHPIGDAVLQQVGGRMIGVLREADTVARLGGDEFAILLPDVADATAAVAVARKILAAFAPPFVVNAVPHAVGASVGAAMYPDDGADFPALLHHADVVMYAAKHAGTAPTLDGGSHPSRPPSGGHWGSARRERDLRNVSERLVLSALGEQERADQLDGHLRFARALTHSLDEGIYALDTEERLTFINPAAARLLGWDPAERLGAHQGETTPFRHGDDLETPVGVSVGGEQPAFASGDADLVCVRGDGSTFPVAYTVTPMVADGAHMGVVVTFRDITMTRALEQAREESVALIAHDLRNSLTAMLGRAELLRRTLQRQGMEGEVVSLQAILTSGERINRMLTDLQEQTRLESGHAALVGAPTDLRALLAHAIDEGELAALSEGGTPITLNTSESVQVIVDAAQITRVVLNLLTNARKYSPAGSPIRVHLGRNGTDATVSITDRGVGIADTDLPHLFEKYYRTDHTAPVGGLGLGLYISRLIIMAHGGRIWAESVKGTGSTFHFTLPLRE